MTERLKPFEATIIKDIALRAGVTGRVTLKPWQRKMILPLWRRGLVEIWHRTLPETIAGSRGPFHALTTAGFALASAIWAASHSKSITTNHLNGRRSAHARVQ